MLKMVMLKTCTVSQKCVKWIERLLTSHTEREGNCHHHNILTDKNGTVYLNSAEAVKLIHNLMTQKNTKKGFTLSR